jgi:hypothetical protein
VFKKLRVITRNYELKLRRRNYDVEVPEITHFRIMKLIKSMFFCTAIVNPDLDAEADPN